ncbi:stage III sporulation protein AF [Desulfitobacterium metallireducens]|uniref:Stage III sporulation protein AG n=1 Tax=Desulfitobacterium metallireducens DSM 15288 TaxID=871968 RepID=W0E9G5_9FIRM|nr:stage III sporulation protein AF [Desulfitobacterium metallireducens]AHF07407.1 stage III sporulation protein AG [Desulfitobacterium metallireducens DSM 15288]
MENLQTLVRNLAIIILLASVLEMLLPNKSMQGFVKLVMGLFVISAVLDPLTALLHLPQSTSIPAWTEVRSQELPVLAGNNGLDIGRNAVQEQFKQIVENQIEALVLGISGVDQVKVEAVFEPSDAGLVDQPQVQRVNIQLNSPKTEMQNVSPITIGNQGNEIKSQPESQSALDLTIKEKISTFLQIPQNKIFVTQK